MGQQFIKINLNLSMMYLSAHLDLYITNVYIYIDYVACTRAWAFICTRITTRYSLCAPFQYTVGHGIQSEPNVV